jgi:hypothetical protein
MRYRFRLPIQALVCLLVLAAFAGGASGRTWLVRVDGTGDAPTIQAAIDSTSPGDSVLVAPGTYTWNNQGTTDPYGMIHVVRGQNDFVLASQAGAAATILDGQFQGRIMFIAGYNNIVIDGFTIRNGRAPALGNFVGGGIAAHLTHDTVKNCIFFNNEAQASGGALWCGGVSSMTIENCRFYGNRARIGAGMFFINSSQSPHVRDCLIDSNNATESGGGVYAYNNPLSFENTLIVLNTADVSGGGVRVTKNQPATFTRCTISHNSAPVASCVEMVGSSLTTLDRCIVSFGGTGAAFGMSNSSLAVGCSNVFGNIGGNSFPAGTIDNGGNFSLDPLFCNAGAKNFYIDGSSPCSDGNHPDAEACGLIGARPVQCGQVPVERHTWGSLKALYQ